MNIFLTGGTGFIGSYVALEMAGQGHRVTVLARNPAKVPALAKIPNVEIVPPAASRAASGSRNWSGAGMPSFIWRWITQIKRAGRSCSTIRFRACSFRMRPPAGVRHFIYTSSTAVNDSLYTGGGNSPEEQIKLCTAVTKQPAR